MSEDICNFLMGTLFGAACASLFTAYVMNLARRVGRIQPHEIEEKYEDLFPEGRKPHPRQHMRV